MGGKQSKSEGNGNNNNNANTESKEAELPRQVNSVLINVYQPRQASPMGGVYHSGIELYDTEYMFGAGSSSLPGITSHRPRQLADQQWQFYQTVNLGTTDRSREEIRNLIQQMKQSGEWPGNAYSLTGKNCNHFSEAVAKALGLTFPSWINRGAKLMNAIGMGTGKQPQQQVDLDGQPLRASDTAALVIESIVDVCVDSLIDLKRVGLLGAKPSSSLLNIIPVDETGKRIQLKVDKLIQSDADEQLLLFIPFTKQVKLLSFLMRLSVKDPQSNPKTLKLFVNRPNMDFSDADSIPPTQTFTVPSNPGRAFTKEETKEGLWEYVVTVTPVKFVATNYLTIFIAENHGAPTTKLAGLTLVGREK